jgi:hypothetical protein
MTNEIVPAQKTKETFDVFYSTINNTYESKSIPDLEDEKSARKVAASLIGDRSIVAVSVVKRKA